jgi:ligand-binding sensor domain-containing protein
VTIRPALRVAICAAWLAAAVAPAARPLAYDFRCYGPAQGLGQSQAQALLQDRRGYLWIGTSGGGLDRFDGQRFENYSTRNGLPSNIVNAIAEDGDGAIWAATEQGVARLRNGTWQTFGEEDGLPSALAHAMFASAEHGVWAGTAKGAARFQGDRFVPWPTPPGDPAAWVEAIAGERGGGLLFAGQSGLMRLAEGNWTQLVEEPTVDVVATSAKIWALGISKLWRLDGNPTAPAKPVAVRPADRSLLSPNRPALRRLFAESDGTVWVIGERGALRLTQPELRLGPREGVPTYTVYALLRDREGSLWLGTDGAGVCQVANLAFTHIGKDQGLPSESVFQIERVGEEIWIATDGGMAAVGSGSDAVRRVWPEVPAVRFLREPASDAYWLATPQRLVYEQAGERREYAAKEGLNSMPFAMTRDASGRLLVGTMGEGVWRLEGNRFHKMPGGPLAVQGFQRDRAGRLWCFGYNGVWLVGDEGLSQPAGLAKGLSDVKVVFAEMDAHGTLWFATNGRGVRRMDPRHPEVAMPPLTSAEGLTDDTTYLVHFDRRGDLWVGTRRGLDRIDGESLRRGVVRARRYGGAEGVYGVEMNTAVFEDANGDLWFGTVSGAVRYRTQEDRPAAPPPQPLLRTLAAAGETRPRPWDQNPIIFPHSQRGVAFAFEAPSFRGGELTYQFRFRPEDPWSPPDRSAVANLPTMPVAGRYALEARACREAECGPPSTPIWFTVRPPWWARPWFLLLAAAALIGGGLRAYRSRIQNLEAAERHALIEHDLIQARLESLRYQLQPHFLFNTLNMLSSLIRERRTTEAVDTIAGIGDLLRYSLMTVNQQKVPLRDEVHCAEQYLRIQQGRFADRLRVVIDVDPAVRGAAVPSFSLQPLLENAIQHGMRGATHPLQVELRAHAAHGRLQVAVLDDGRGADGPVLSRHVGLGTLEARLANLYRDARLDLRQRPEGGFAAVLDLPLEQLETPGGGLPVAERAPDLAAT